MRNILILILAVIFSGCAIVPAKAQPASTTDLTADIKRLEEEQRRTGEKVGEVRALIESDKLEGLEDQLASVLKALETFRGEVEDDRVAMATFKENLKKQVADATGWSNYQSIGMAGGVGILGAGGLVGRKRKGG